MKDLWFGAMGVSILIVVLVVGLSAIEGAAHTSVTVPYSDTSTRILPSTSTVSTSAGTETVLVTNSSDELGLSVQAIPGFGGNYTFTVEDSNLLNSMNNLAMNNGWMGSPNSVSYCGFNGVTPVDLVILQGRYGTNNFTRGQALALYNTGYIHTCGALSFSHPAPYSFRPLSDSYAIYSGLPPFTGVAEVTITTGGYWTGAAESPTNPGSAAFNSFSPGVYTLVGEDEWGNVALLQFTIK